MAITARDIITLALESMNRLSPGEVVDADVAAACLRRLNLIADDWSAVKSLQPQSVIVSGVVTGATLTLGAGPFAAIAPGTELTALQSDGRPMEKITMQQYNDIAVKSQPGRPETWAPDGLATVYLYPVAVGNTVNVLCQQPFSQFADLDTGYTLPPGYRGAFAATLAVAMAPSLLGKVSAELLMAERRAMFNVSRSRISPETIHSSPFECNGSGGALLGFN